jgi:hypothetical protein
MLKQLQTFLQNIPDILTPKPVLIEVSLDEKLSDAIAQAVHDPKFKKQSIDPNKHYQI